MTPMETRLEIIWKKPYLGLSMGRNGVQEESI
jgi:hypothetical protein